MGERQFTLMKTELRTGHAHWARAADRRVAPRIIGLGIVLLLACDSAFADFLVQPMVVRRAVMPGRRIPVELKIENIDPKISESLTLRLAELTQKPDASWKEMLPDDPNLSQAVVRSCRSWITLPQASITVPPFKIQPFTIQVDVPGNTRGFYFAAIVASTAPRDVTTAPGIVTPVSLQLVVPVILEIQGLAVKRSISLSDIGLDFRPQTVEAPAASSITLDITNAGGTFSRLQPIVRLWGQSGGHWLKISDTRLPEVMIMPGGKLHLTKETDQLLASGTYRLEGFMFVDGQRGSLIRKDAIQFKGASSGLVRGEPALSVKPSTLFLDSLSGATRSAYLQVVNMGEDQVTVQAEVKLPDHMRMAVNNQGVKGEELGCADWVTVTPNQFTLKGHSRQNLSVVVRMPKEAAKYPSYYADLKLHVSYGDGPVVGTKDSRICVQNKPGVGTTGIKATVLSISETTPSRYAAVAHFLNAGETHITPTCEGVLSIIGGGPGGASIYKRFLMTSEAAGQTGALLPFESRTFSGILDFSDVPAGRYYVTAVLNYPGGPADGLQMQKAVIVSEQGGQKIARMTEAAQQVVIKLM